MTTPESGSLGRPSGVAAVWPVSLALLVVSACQQNRPETTDPAASMGVPTVQVADESKADARFAEQEPTDADPPAAPRRVGPVGANEDSRVEVRTDEQDLAGAETPTPTYRVRLIRINEDFGLVVRNADGEIETVRILGVLFPERGSDKAERARAFIRRAFDSPFLLVSEQRPARKDHLTAVYVDVLEAHDTAGPIWFDLGEDLIRRGLAGVDVGGLFSREERYMEIANVKAATVRLVKVNDDLSVVVRNTKRGTRTVRLVGITLPEPGSEAAERARKRIRRCFDSPAVRIIIPRPDRNDEPEMVYMEFLFGLDVGDWWIDLGTSLLGSGLAEVDTTQSFWRKQRYLDIVKGREQKAGRSGGP